MQNEIIISGFGGQGVLFAGQLLAFAALDDGKHVTWFPSYGPEMRGGTAHCTVIISDQEIGSPVVRNPRAAIVMNLPSLDRYETLVQPGGVLVVNSSLVNRTCTRNDLMILELPANEIAEELGDRRLTNLVLLGALLHAIPVLEVPTVKKALVNHLPERHKDLLTGNKKALDRGYEYPLGEMISA
jgi:2-oxoglutarate ferredoxin oxidoreductase subunit gamma